MTHWPDLEAALQGRPDVALGGIQLGGQRLTALRLQTELEPGQRPRLPRLQAIELYPDFTRDHLQRLAAQQPQHHVPFPARAPPLPGRQGPRPNRRGVGADSAPCTLLDPTMPPTSFDIGFSLNPCPRKLGAPHRFLREGQPKDWNDVVIGGVDGAVS